MGAEIQGATGRVKENGKENSTSMHMHTHSSLEGREDRAESEMATIDQSQHPGGVFCRQAVGSLVAVSCALGDLPREDLPKSSVPEGLRVWGKTEAVTQPRALLPLCMSVHMG